MDGNSVYIPHSQTEHAAAIDSVFFDNLVPPVEIVQPTMVSILFWLLYTYNNCESKMRNTCH